MSARAKEYRQLITEIIDGHDRNIACGLPGLEEDEWVQLKDLVKKVQDRIKPANHQDLENHIDAGSSPGSVE